MKCMHPGCTDPAILLTKLIANQAGERRELNTDVKVCAFHLPGPDQFGKHMKDFLRGQLPKHRRLFGPYVEFTTVGVPLITEEAADHERGRPN